MPAIKKTLARKAVKSTAKHTAHGTASKLKRNPVRATTLTKRTGRGVKERKSKKRGDTEKKGREKPTERGRTRKTKSERHEEGKKGKEVDNGKERKAKEKARK